MGCSGGTKRVRVRDRSVVGTKRRLKGDAPRLLGSHGGPEGAHYRRKYRSLEVDYGPFVSEGLRDEAGDVASARLDYEIASRELSAHREDPTHECDASCKVKARLERRKDRRQRVYKTLLQGLKAMVERSHKSDTLSELLLARAR
jgi:hypothetical protein